MRAFVTGAAGFVGSHLCDALLDRGDSVVGIDCFTPYYEREHKEANISSARGHDGFVFLEEDLRHADIATMLDGIDVVYHQAAQPGVRLSWSDGFATYVEQNVLVTQRLLEAARTMAKPPKVVYASSSSAYGNQPRYPTVETDVCAPHSPYGVTKLAGEHLCGLYAANYGLSTVALRYFTVFGPRQRPDMSIHRLCEVAIRGGSFPRFGDGQQVREFTYVGDIVAGNIAAAQAEIAPGTFANLAGGGEITLNSLVDLVSEIAGRAISIDQQPAQAGDASRNGGATDRARELFGWAPRVSLRDGITAQLAWHQSR